MDEPRPDRIHVSSAVVFARPECARDAVDAINRFPDAEVFHCEGGKIVVVLEGPNSKAAGDRLAEISLMEGVISANLVYEQVESLESLGESS